MVEFKHVDELISMLEKAKFPTDGQEALLVELKALHPGFETGPAVGICPCCNRRTDAVSKYQYQSGPMQDGSSAASD